jgi:hypothetical protein
MENLRERSCNRLPAVDMNNRVAWRRRFHCTLRRFACQTFVLSRQSHERAEANRAGARAADRLPLERVCDRPDWRDQPNAAERKEAAGEAAPRIKPLRGLKKARQQVQSWVKDGKAELRKVRVTRDLGTRVEVDTGVKWGDQVILNPPVNLVDGSKVTPRLEAAASG